jgi:thiamine-phosphate pyrophosphorylase
MAVKARQRARGGKLVPALWLFTDRMRVRDPVDAVRRLPPGLAGVVLRDSGAESEVRVRRIARICRQRRLWLSVAGDSGMAVRFGGGLHLRGGHRCCGPRPSFLTSSAHDRADVRRAVRAGAALIFVSPVFATMSHPGAPALGVAGWSVLARPGRLGALGGIDARTVRRLPGWCRYIGAVGALAR